MKNFITKKKSPVPVALALVSVALLSFQACDETDPLMVSPETPSEELSVTPASVARMLSGLPLTIDQVREVWDGAMASSANGYDEEYTFKDMFAFPGRRVGDDLIGTRSAATYPFPLSSMVSDNLASSGLQIYWPYSESWDGKSLPTITYCPEIALESNVGYLREELPDGSWIVKEMVVDEDYARCHPVWVIGWNDDAGAVTPQVAEAIRPESATRAATDFKTLRLKEFKAHVQYDSWLAGGSEFYIKCGSLKAFTADIVADLSKYNPEITDLMIKVKRAQTGKALRYNSVIVSEWSSQLTECAFLMIEDDGGKVTSWKSSGKVTIKSKSYGFDVEIPYHRNDDIVWRGKLSYNYLEKNNGVANRFGDVSVTFIFN